MMTCKEFNRLDRATRRSILRHDGCVDRSWKSPATGRIWYEMEWGSWICDEIKVQTASPASWEPR